jgi:hypothetical protein
MSYLGLFGEAALHAFVVFAVAFYLLRDDHRLSRWARDHLTDDPGPVEAYVRAVDNDLNTIFFGNILNAIITGTIGAIVYSLLTLAAPQGVAIPYAALVGLLTGVASLVPVVGMKVVYVPIAAYLFARPLFLVDAPGVLWFPTAFFVVSFVLVDLIPDLVLRPYVSGRNLHVGMVMMAYVLGPLLFGWYGIFLAPLLLVLVVHFARIVLPDLVTGDPVGTPNAPAPAADRVASTGTDATDAPVAESETTAGADRSGDRASHDADAARASDSPPESDGGSRTDDDADADEAAATSDTDGQRKDGDPEDAGGA